MCACRKEVLYPGFENVTGGTLRQSHFFAVLNYERSLISATFVKTFLQLLSIGVATTAFVYWFVVSLMSGITWLRTCGETALRSFYLLLVIS